MEDHRPWRGQDDFGGFVYRNIAEELSKLAGQLGFSEIQTALQDTEFTVEHIPKDDGGPDWENEIFKEIVESATGNCLDVSWFFLEYYLYRRILGVSTVCPQECDPVLTEDFQELGYFNKSSAGYEQDPWRIRKEGDFNEALDYVKEHPIEGDFNNSDMLRRLLKDCAWASDPFGGVQSMIDQGRLLVDDTDSVIDFVQNKVVPRSKVIIIVGYCGISLTYDLRLAHWFVKNGAIVEFHTKPTPCGPLLATRADLEAHINGLSQGGIAFAQGLSESFQRGDLAIHDDSWYTGPYGLSSAPEALKQRFDQATLIIASGDDNFRRACGDRQLPVTFPFSEIAKSFTRTPVVSLRTCRSPTLVSVSPNVDASFTDDTEWCVEKRYAMIAFASGQLSPEVAAAPSSAELPKAQDTQSIHGEDPQDHNVYEDTYFDAGNDYFPPPEASISPRESSANGVTSGNQGNDSEYRSPQSKKHRSRIDDDSDADADNENDANDLPWSNSLGKLGIEACLEEFGTKDNGRPYIKAHLPERVRTAYEYFAETRKGESEESINEQWSSMQKSQKQKYEMLSQQDKMRYDQKLIERARDVALALRAHYATN